MRNEKLYLQHMIEASARIEDYAKFGKDEFFKKEMMHDAIIKVLANLTESASHINSETKAEYIDVPWSLIKSFRNMLVHDYLGDR